MRINSITDVITNSSTSVFVVYAEHNIDSIKELVNSILAIEGKYTFDDLFDIELELNYYTIENFLDDLSDEFNELKENNDWDPIIKGYSPEKKKALVDELWDLINNSYSDSYHKSPYAGIKITPKKDIVNLADAARIISRIDGIFDLDYTCDW
jgi:ABC-type uncharacterized transport system ATPase subunit